LIAGTVIIVEHPTLAPRTISGRSEQCGSKIVHNAPPRQRRRSRCFPDPLNVVVCDFIVVRDLDVVVRDLNVVVRDLNVVVHDLDIVVRDLDIVVRDLNVIVRDLNVVVRDLNVVVRDLNVVVRDLNVVVRDLNVVIPDLNRDVRFSCCDKNCRSYCHGLT
jgi:hypothetical protein